MKELTDIEKRYLHSLLRRKTPLKEEARSVYNLWKEAKKGKVNSKEAREIDNNLRALISHAFVFKNGIDKT